MALEDELRACPTRTKIVNVDTGERGEQTVVISLDLRDRILAALTERKAPVEVEGLVERAGLFPRIVTHDEARAAAKNFIDAHFHNREGKGVLTGIPARADHDDLVLSDYIKQRRAADEAAATELATLKQRIAELEAENFTLAAGQCTVENGLIGDEHGHFACSLKQQLAEREEALREADRVIERIASQKTWDELDDPESADWQGGYHGCVDTARAFLTRTDGGDQ